MHITGVIQLTAYDVFEMFIPHELLSYTLNLITLLTNFQPNLP